MHIAIFKTLMTSLSFLLISVSSLFNLYDADKVMIGVNNADKTKSSTIVNTVISYNTIYEYNSKIPTGIVNVLKDGVDGIVYKTSDGKEVKTLIEKQDKIIEVGTGLPGEFIGVVTGYGPDCDTCDGRGYVYCPTKTGKWTNLITDGIYYQDETFGKVQIIAADPRQFPCGTVMSISNKYLNEPILGIVLDTGAAMRYGYDHGYVHIDVAFETEVGLTFATDKNTQFSVKRWGW